MLCAKGFFHLQENISYDVLNKNPRAICNQFASPGILAGAGALLQSLKPRGCRCNGTGSIWQLIDRELAGTGRLVVGKYFHLVITRRQASWHVDMELIHCGPLAEISMVFSFTGATISPLW